MADAEMALSVLLVAVTVAVLGAGTLAGAV
jgi:hypothetical protein